MREDGHDMGHWQMRLCRRETGVGIEKAVTPEKGIKEDKGIVSDEMVR